MIILWIIVIGLGTLTAWSLVDGLVLDARRARRRFDALATALQRTPVAESDSDGRVDLDVDARTITMRSVHVGSQSQVRGETGRLWVMETPLRGGRWEMHDVGIRQRRRAAAFDRRFVIRESGVPVREGWLGQEVRQALATFFDDPLALGALRVDRGRLQHVASWSRAPEQPSAADLRTLVDRFHAVAEAFDEAASRRHPMG